MSQLDKLTYPRKFCSADGQREVFEAASAVPEGWLPDRKGFADKGTFERAAFDAQYPDWFADEKKTTTDRPNLGMTRRELVEALENRGVVGIPASARKVDLIEMLEALQDDDLDDDDLDDDDLDDDDLDDDDLDDDDLDLTDET